MIRRLQFAARLCLWLILAVVTLEVSARTEDKLRYGAAFFGNYSLDSLYQYDELGKYGRPFASYLKWHLNEAGYRGPGLRQGTFRIACIGSSETFGLYETAENEWPRQLERILDQRSGTRGYEVIDAAYPGLSVGTSLLRLPQLLDAVHPQMLVIYPSYTSYIENDQAQPWPLQATAHPEPKPEHKHFEWRIAARTETFLKASVPDGVQDWIRGLQVRRMAKRTKVMQRLPEQNVTAFQTDLTRLVAEAESQGIHVVLVTHANRFGKTVAPEDARVLTAWRKFYPTIEEGGLLDMEAKMSEVVREVGRRTGVPVVDGANLIPPGRVNFVEFVHFTDVGARTLATLVADEIGREAAAGTFPAPRPSTTANSSGVVSEQTSRMSGREAKRYFSAVGGTKFLSRR